MGPKRARKKPTAEKAAFQKVAKNIHKLATDLSKETTPSAILKHLEALTAKLNDEDELTADAAAIVFLGAGGLPPVIRNLRGTAASHPTPHPDVSPDAISAEAGRALTQLLRYEDVMPELLSTRGFTPALLDALRDAPDNEARLAAVRGLWIYAQEDPEQWKAMAESGVFESLLALFDEMGEEAWASKSMRLPAALGCMMVGKISARDLERAIRAPGVVRAFTALVFLLVGTPCLHPAWFTPLHLSVLQQRLGKQVYFQSECNAFSRSVILSVRV
jgi:hypothetical protein